MTAISRDFATEANLNAWCWAVDPEGPAALPSIQVGGVQVFVYVDAAALHYGCLCTSMKLPPSC
ncbi:hypothetical protein SANTM175S_08418 [Streptomyces antimycoticus]